MEAWHTKKIDAALHDCAVTRDGLSDGEAARRIAERGGNQLDEPKKKGWLYHFVMQFKNVMVIVLLAAAAVAAAVAIFEKDPKELIDGGIILFIVVMNAIVGVVQEYKAEHALAALKDLSKPYAKVRRGGEVISIPSVQIAEGDIVILEAGDMVPADLRLISCSSLKTDESALTGESAAVEKTAVETFEEHAPLGDRHNMAFSGSMVTYGRGEGVAVCTGMRAEMGKIAAMLNTEKNEDTPIQKQIDHTGKIISIAVLAIAAVIFGISLLSCFKTGIGVTKIVDAFMTGIAIAVAAIPEGLTAVITIIMAIGVQTMSRKRAIVRRLPAVETLGSTEVICSDKTGTLTQNRMTVKRVFTSSNALETGSGTGREYLELVRCMTLCNDARQGAGKDGAAVGDPTETALVEYAAKHGFAKSQLERDFARVDEVPFDSERKLMTTVHRTGGGVKSYTKGAPDILLARCTKILDGDGMRPITDRDRSAVTEECAGMAKKALRVLAFAMDESGSKTEKQMVFIGLAGMIDPPRKEVKDAVRVCRHAGIKPIMITGDHRDTAFAIAKELGISSSESEMITGTELSALSDVELERDVEKYRVFARVSPEHKVRIVKAWKKRGKVVAMTGDGVNDAPSIKAADIGIGMGISGTDVTKGAADMVLADDNFATIVAAVEEGRKIYSNIQKTIQFLLSANVAEVLSLFLATVLFAGRGFVFLLPIQILWINLVTDSLPALALGLEPPEPDVMMRPPRKDSKNLLSGKMGVNILYQGMIQTIIVLGVYIFCVFYEPWGHNVGTTMAFLVLNLIQLFHCFNAKSLDHSILKTGIFKNKFMILSFVIGVLLTVVVVAVPPLASLFGLCRLNFVQWLTVVLASFLIIPIVEIMKK